MKIIQSPQQITPFGGLTFVYQFLENKRVGQLINSYLCDLPNQSKYTWKDIIYSLWSIPFCGGDCVEDLSTNLKSYIRANPYFEVPSSDSVSPTSAHLQCVPHLFLQPRENQTFYRRQLRRRAKNRWFYA